MGIYIKDMSKPINCNQCPISLWALPKDCNLEIGICPIIEISDDKWKKICNGDIFIE